MTNLQARAHELAAASYVDEQQLKLDSCELYPRLKALASRTNVPASEAPEFAFKPEHHHLCVAEIVQQIEASANAMLAFGKLVLEAAHEGLMDAVDEPGFEMDAYRWDFTAFAEARI